MSTATGVCGSSGSQYTHTLAHKVPQAHRMFHALADVLSGLATGSENFAPKLLEAHESSVPVPRGQTDLYDLDPQLWDTEEWQ